MKRREEKLIYFLFLFHLLILFILLTLFIYLFYLFICTHVIFFMKGWEYSSADSGNIGSYQNSKNTVRKWGGLRCEE